MIFDYPLSQTSYHHGHDLPEEDIRVLSKIIPDVLFDLRSAGEAFEYMKQMGLSGASPLGEVK